MNRKLPRMASALMPRELSCWGFTAITLGALEGGLLGVIVKNQFSGAASSSVLNLTVAVVAGAPAFTNLSSFLFASFAQGRDKLGVLHGLIIAMGLLLGLMALVPLNAPGLLAFCVLTVLARAAWTGVLTVRAAVWRANYRRDWRARVTARIIQLSSLLVAGYAAAIGFMLEWRPFAFRPMFLLAAVAACIAARRYRGGRVRRQRQLLAAERAEQALSGRRLGLRRLLGVLQADTDFRRYMGGMMVFGSGNLMVIPMLVVMLNERTGLTQALQVLITSSLPLLMLCLAVPWWARLLDRRHIFAYRAIHSWFYVFSFALFALAMGAGAQAMLWPAAVVLGIANAGAHLGWNLGHNDFSSDANAAHYMAVHVTLTGLRGLVMPLLGVGFYQWLAWRHPDLAAWALAFPLSLTLGGALLFVALHLEREGRAGT